MKNVTSLQQIQDCVNRRDEFFHQINGKKYSFNVVNVLSLTLLEAINMIKDKRLFYEPQY